MLDECHRAKNLVPTSGSKPTKTGRSVMELQKALPNARIVYASATGATGKNCATDVDILHSTITDSFFSYKTTISTFYAIYGISA